MGEENWYSVTLNLLEPAYYKYAEAKNKCKS